MKRERHHIEEPSYFYNPYYDNNGNHTYPLVQYYDPYYGITRPTYNTFNYPYNYLYSYTAGNNLTTHINPYGLPVDNTPKLQLKNYSQWDINKKFKKDISQEESTDTEDEKSIGDVSKKDTLEKIYPSKLVPRKDEEILQKKDEKNLLDKKQDVNILSNILWSYSDVPKHIPSSIPTVDKNKSDLSTKKPTKIIEYHPEQKSCVVGSEQKYKRLFYTRLHQKLKRGTACCFIGNYFFIVPKDRCFCKNIRRHNIHFVTFSIKNREFLICWTTVTNMHDIPLFKESVEPIELPGMLSKPKVINGKNVLFLRNNIPCKVMSSKMFDKYVECAKRIGSLIINTHKKNNESYDLNNISSLASKVEKTLEYRRIVEKIPGHINNEISFIVD